MAFEFSHPSHDALMTEPHATRSPDTSHIRAAAEGIAAHGRPGQLVILPPRAILVHVENPSGQSRNWQHL